MDSKRVLLAVVLSTAVMVLYSVLFPQKVPPPIKSEEKLAGNVNAITESVSVPAEIMRAAEPTVEKTVSKTIFANDVIQVELSNKGAAVVGAELLQYLDKRGPEGKHFPLLSSSSGFDEVGGTRLHKWSPNEEIIFTEKEKSANRITYAWSSPEGLGIEKEYSLESGNYHIDLRVKLINSMPKSVDDKLGILLVQDFSKEIDRYAFQGPAYFLGQEYEEVKLKKIKEGVKNTGNISWVAMMQKYFLVALVPESSEGLEFSALGRGESETIAEVELTSKGFTLDPNTQQTFNYKIYLGPKRTETLGALGSNLEQVVNFGFFTVVAKPLQVFLKSIYSVIGNYGIAIILLTTLVKVLFWPISAKGYRSMQRMKDLQPKMEKIKEKYADDRERLSMEMMQLYKTHKVNPMGGCLPMVVQIPVFFALYRVLLTSIELRHAPFMLWIQDLSAPDRLLPNLGLPYLGGIPVLTLLMGGSMFLQQKLTPTAGAAAEPQMKMMMYGMPVIFTFMFLNFPSGLVLYWLVNNMLGIAQQVMLARESKAAV